MKAVFGTVLSILLATSLQADAIGKVSFFVGKVKVKPETAQEWKEVRMQMPITAGDQVQTEKADRLEITLKDGSIIRIAENSDITLTAPNSKTIAPSVQKGKIWGNIKKLGQRSYDFEVTSATATAAIRGTIFRVDELDSNTDVSVYDGKVAVGPGRELKKKVEEMGGPVKKEIGGPTEVPGPFEVTLMDWVTIVKGQRISVKRDGKYAQTKINAKEDAVDEWAKFNHERDSTAAIPHGN